MTAADQLREEAIHQIREHMEVIGADGVHIGTVEAVIDQRIMLSKQDSGQGSHRHHNHYIPLALVAEVEGDKVRLSANSNVAVTFEEEEDGRQPLNSTAKTTQA